MTQEDKKLLLKDLCARLPYEPKVQYKEKTYNLLGLDKGRIFVNIIRLGEWLPTVYTFDIKPYLRPLSSMTEEEALKVVELCVCSPKDVLSVSVKQDCISVEVDDCVAESETYTIWFNEIVTSIELFDWLNTHHFDYRGLIPMGLALEAPEDMYK